MLTVNGTERMRSDVQYFVTSKLLYTQKSTYVGDIQDGTIPYFGVLTFTNVQDTGLPVFRLSTSTT